MMNTRNLIASDHAGWLRLWRGYCAFYQEPLPDSVTAATWAALLAPEQAILGRCVSTTDGSVIGFSLSVLHSSTWQLRPSCYLEDLFVDPDHRGSGAGRALIDDLMAMAQDRNWGRLYWHTEAGNVAARRLYDRYTTADDFVRYRLNLP
jgi:GNAT superfamily N-acetyltransferase